MSIALQLAIATCKARSKWAQKPSFPVRRARQTLANFFRNGAKPIRGRGEFRAPGERA